MRISDWSSDVCSSDLLLRTSDVVAPPARIERNRPHIARLFASDRLEDILAALEDDGSEWAEKELRTIGAKSPTSCQVAPRRLAQGAGHRDALAALPHDVVEEASEELEHVVLEITGSGSVGEGGGSQC